MPFPPGWEWLDDPEFDDDWETPEELRGPVPSVDINIAIRMLSRGTLGNDFNVLVGRFVSESELFNMWFRQNKGGGWGDRETALLLVESGRWTRRVYEAWRNLDEGAEGSWEHRRLALMATLHAVIAEMRAERTGR